MSFNLRSKFSIVIILIVVGLMAVVITTTRFSLSDVIKLGIQKDLFASWHIFEQFDELNKKELIAKVALAAESPMLKAVVSTPDLNHATIVDNAQSMREAIGSDILVLTDERGRLLASATEPARKDDDLSKNPAIANSLRGSSYQGLWVSEEGQLYRVATVPFTLQNQVVGALLVGYIVNAKSIEALEQLTQCQMALIYQGRMVSSAHSQPLFEELNPLINRSSSMKENVFIHKINGQRYIILTFFGPNSTTYVLMRSLDSELQHYSGLQFRLLVLALGILCLALATGVFFADSITRPVRNLVKGAGQISKGDLTARVPVDSGDEIGELATSFNKMAEDLQKSSKMLIQSEKMAAVGQLAGGVAHDFNNYLTVINGYADMLLMSLPPEDPLYEDIKQILQSGTRAQNLTRQLLAFSRNQVINPVLVNLNTIVFDMNKMLKRLVGENIEIEIIAEESLNMVKVDPSQIEQVIMNLVVNARDAMSGKGKITLKTQNTILNKDDIKNHEGLSSGSYVQLSVIDTGTGMSEEVRRHLFEPFFTTKPKGKGTGLGLATCYGIVKQMKGSIVVHSEINKGTAFDIFIPAEKKASDGSEKKEMNKNLSRRYESILLVEDETMVREFCSRILKEQGYNLFEASNGAEAVKLFEELLSKHIKIDLLLTDVMMPQMSGKEAADSIKRMCPDIKVLFMTGYKGDILDVSGVTDSNIELIAKPFTRISLLERIDGVLGKKGDL